MAEGMRARGFAMGGELEGGLEDFCSDITVVARARIAAGGGFATGDPKIYLVNNILFINIT